MSGNHNQSIDRALELVELASKSGANAIKLQTYTPRTMTLDLDHDEFVINDPNSLWNGRSLFSLYQEAYTPWEWHEEIFNFAKSLGLICFSSPFDDDAVDFLEKLDVPCYKIASFECVDLPLIRKVAATGKPVIISTGMATISEIAEAVETARTSGCKELALLKCTSTYPATPINTNLKTIPNMKELFNCEVGISDHTMGIGVSLASIPFGSTIIEKHFTVNRAEGGVDSAFSLEPSELKMLVLESKRAWEALGEITYGGSITEELARGRRRSLYFSRDLNAGDILTKENIARIRPGLGLHTRYYDAMFGKKLRVDIKKGTPVSWALIE
jgi:N-acetylneuraminate synthase